ncbi:right-handed parallel beta-helix repeat-containing protein [Planctomycetota bacterium]
MIYSHNNWYIKQGHSRSGSTDDNGIKKYEWDFTNNGSYDYYETASYHPDGAFDGKTTYTYDSNETAKLQVTENHAYSWTDTDTISVYVSNDSDGDGLPSLWEEAYGLSDSNAADADEDLDSDSYNNLSEYLHETDPNDNTKTPSTNITINVPDDVNTIQRAIDASIDGDTIIVFAGTYYETIDFDGKEITVQSSDPNNWNIVDTTIIDANDANEFVISFDSAEDADSVLKGFTLTGGNLGIYCETATPVISNCVITGNGDGTNNGGGMYDSNSAPSVTNCFFVENDANFGGGIYDINSAPILANCVFYDNSASFDGGGIYDINSTMTLTNCTFAKNTAGDDGGAMCNKGASSQAVMANCIFWNDTAVGDGNEVYKEAGADPNFSYSCIEGSGGSSSWDSNFGSNDGNNIDSDPNFVNVDNANGPDGIFGTFDDGLSLDIIEYSSPCVDAADGNSAPSTDIVGRSRIDVDGISNTGIGNPDYVDMGAYESPMIWFVDIDATGSDNGRSWTNAFTDLQDAIAEAGYGHEIWVAQGTYKPTDGNDRTISFELVTGVAVYGGFDAIETACADRDWTLYTTTLSGDINVSDNSNDNSHSVVVGSVTDATTVLDGFTIRGGNAPSSDPFPGYARGAGMYNYNASLTIRNCIFTDNHIGDYGGGMANVSGSNPRIINCVFSDNSADGYGGGVYNSYSDSTFINCVFTGNSAGNGAGMRNLESSPTITNCTFYNNSASSRGGAMHNAYGDSSPVITNSILWGNSAVVDYNEVYNQSSYPYFSYCNIKDCNLGAGTWDWDEDIGTDGSGNIDSDPCFADSSDPDGSDNIFMTHDDGLRITTDGSCIDAADGDNALSADILDRSYVDINDVNNTGTGEPNYVDMGAYEYGCDTDGDGMDDDWEVLYGLDPTDASDAGDDDDSDGLTNLAEYGYKTNPIDSDTDDDGMPDGWEVQYGLDPTNNSDADSDLDSDTYSNVVEFLHGSGPNDDSNLPGTMTIYIPYNVSTIQDAIDWSIDGDVIAVSQGTYYESIDFNGVNCTLASTDVNDSSVVANTVINGNGSGTVVTFDSGENSNAVLVGLTITNGTYGISCSSSSSPSIKQCVIKDNSSHGIYCTLGSPDISYNEISDNGGDGIYSSATTPPTIKNNWIYDNSNGIGFSSAASAATVRNNTIIDNDSNGIYVVSNTAPAISNCIIWRNNDDLVDCSATYSCIEDGDTGTGNISSYPYFEDYDSNDFHLTWNSPCINRGDPNGSYTGETDIDGDGRVTTEIYVADRIDIGADELFDNDIHNSVNRVKNPGFEDGNDSNDPNVPLYWKKNQITEPNVLISIDDANKHSGSYSFKTYHDGSITTGYPHIYSEGIDVEAGEIYNLSAWVKCDLGTEGITLFATGYDSDGFSVNYSTVSIGSIPADEWTYLNLGGIAINGLVDGKSTTQVRVRLFAPFRTEGTIWWDDVSFTEISPEFLPSYGCANEPNIVETVDFGGSDPNNEKWTDCSTKMGSPNTDSDDNNITYRELIAGNTLTIEFPAFNVDPNYDPNDPNDMNSLPLTPMLLEIMYKDTVDDGTTARTAGTGDLVVVKSRLDYIDLDPDYLKSSSRDYDLVHLGGVNDGNWKYMQYGFQKSDYQLLRAIDGKFTIEILNYNDANIPIDYVSLRKITQAEYDNLVNKQRAVRGFDEVDLPADAPNDPNYDDPNITIFVRDIMHPVYKHTQPEVNEPNSITAFSVWGQVEPACFSMYSENGVSDLTITVSDLTHSTDSNSVISEPNITLYHVIYDESRLNYIYVPKTYALLPDYLKEFTTLSVEPNTSETIWLKIRVPDQNDGLSAGLYEGQVNIQRAGEPNVTAAIDFTVYNITLNNSRHSNTVYHDPYAKIFSNNLDIVYDAYRETGVEPFICNVTHRVVASEDVNADYNVVYDSNNFEIALDRMIDEGVISQGSKVYLHISEHTWEPAYEFATGSEHNKNDVNLWDSLSAPNFIGAFEQLLGVYADAANDANITFIFEIKDEPGSNPDKEYKRIVCDRLFTIIHGCNEPNGLQTGASYITDCDDEEVPGDYNIPAPNGPNIPPLTDLVDYKVWNPGYIDIGYASHQDPNYHGNFGYYTTSHSYWANPAYNRFLHGLFAFATDTELISAYAMGVYVNDPFNDFDAYYSYILPFTYPDFIYAYPTWSGELLPTIGGLEGIREGIKDARYIATLEGLIENGYDPCDSNFVDANDYLDDLYSSIDPNYPTAYSGQATELGYYKAILEDISDINDPNTGDPNDFEAFTEIRQNVVDFIVAIDPNA